MSLTISLTSSKNPTSACKTITLTSTISNNSATGFVVFYVDQEGISLPIQIDPTTRTASVEHKFKGCKKSHTVQVFYFDTAVTTNATLIEKVCH